MGDLRVFLWRVYLGVCSHKVLYIIPCFEVFFCFLIVCLPFVASTLGKFEVLYRGFAFNFWFDDDKRFELVTN